MLLALLSSTNFLQPFKLILTLFTFASCIASPIYSIETPLQNSQNVVRAAIDLGSVAIKIQVSIVDPKHNSIVKSLYSDNSTINLAEDIATHAGRISDSVQERLMHTLSIFKKKAISNSQKTGLPPLAFSGVATSLLAKAKNGQELLEKIENELGIHFHILSPSEESMLIFMSAKALYPEINENDLIAWDSGDRNFQFIAKGKEGVEFYQASLGHGFVRDILMQDIRNKPTLFSHESGNPIGPEEAEEITQRMVSLLPTTPKWLIEKLGSKDTVVVSFGDGENNFSVIAQALAAIATVQGQNGSLDRATFNFSDLEKIVKVYIGKGDKTFDAADIHRKTLTKAVFLETLMGYFKIKKVYYKRTSGNSAGMLITPSFWTSGIIKN